MTRFLQRVLRRLFSRRPIGITATTFEGPGGLHMTNVFLAFPDGVVAVGVMNSHEGAAHHAIWYDLPAAPGTAGEGSR